MKPLRESGSFAGLIEKQIGIFALVEVRHSLASRDP